MIQFALIVRLIYKNVLIIIAYTVVLFQGGKYVELTDLASTSLREAMGTYYDDSSIPITDIPTYTMPYKDFFTNGRFPTNKVLRNTFM